MKEINIERRKGGAFPHGAAAKPRWLIGWWAGKPVPLFLWHGGQVAGDHLPSVVPFGKDDRES